MAGLRALKIQSEAITASFRYPRVQAGCLKTFDMPPPATIYGHLAGVVGEWFDPDGLQFSYVFEHAGKASDMETRHPIQPAKGKKSKSKRGWDFPVNVECEPNPQTREFLFRPKLTLYLVGNEGMMSRLAESFAKPLFTYVIGRSQDLAWCKSADFIELDYSAEAWFAHTILPYEWRPWVVPGTSVMMPSVIDYRRNREARNSRYLQITYPSLAVFPNTKDTISRTNLPAAFTVDRQEQRAFEGNMLSRGINFAALLNSI